MNITVKQEAQEVIVGRGVFSQLPETLNRYKKQGVETVFLVTGETSFNQPVVQSVIEPLKQEFQIVRFSGFESNPQERDINDGLKQYATLSKPIVVAIGGGSAIDMAKLIYYFGNQGGDIRSFFTEKQTPVQSNFETPLIACPTTSGTGSESTQFATLYIDNIKQSLDTPAILPSVAIVDAALTDSLPTKVTAECGMDALTQAVESYWSVKSTDQSKKLAAEAIQLICPHLKNVVLSPDAVSREAMAKGANLAGQAIHITRTTAAHALSYPMTSFFDVAHGQAVSITLPLLFQFNHHVTKTDCLDERGVDYVKQTLNELVSLMGHESIEGACTWWTHLMQEIGLKTSLKDLGIESSDWDLLLQHGFTPNRVKNNPRELTQDDAQIILETIGG